MNVDLNTFVREIKETVDIIEVISQYVPLRKKGINFFGLSPFKNEKTPSFCVNPQKQYYTCFASGESGDVLSFLQKIENMDFITALRFLADKYNIAFPENSKTSESYRTSQQNIYDIMESITNYYHQLLFKPEGKHALEYLKSRKISMEMIKVFKLGYSKNSWDDIIQWAQKNNIDQKALLETGILNKKESSTKYYDRFRNRLMFPIRNDLSRIISFSSRVLDPNEKTAKYINGPETKVFKKSEVFYGLDIAKKTKAGDIIICEGQLDVITCHQIGIDNVICIQGTAFTENHAKKIIRYGKEITLAYDGDDAGQKALERTSTVLLSQNNVPNIITFPQDSDPNEFLLKNKIDELKEIFQHKLDGFDFLHKHYKQNNEKLSTAKQKTIVVKTLLSKLNLLSDKILKSSYLDKISINCGTEKALLLEEIKKNHTSSKRITLKPKQTISSISKKNHKFLSHELFLLNLCLNNSIVAEWLLKHIKEHFWQQRSEGCRIIYALLVLSQEMAYSQAQEKFIDAYKGDTQILKAYCNTSYPDILSDKSKLQSAVYDCVKKLLIQYYIEKIDEIEINVQNLAQYQKFTQARNLVKQKKFSQIFSK